MKTISTHPINIFLFYVSSYLTTNSFSQNFIPDGNYNARISKCTNKIVDANASSTCQVERVFAVTKVVELINTFLIVGY
jgi:hypothetical protein